MKPTPPKTTTPSTKPAVASVAGQILSLVNTERAAAGCKPVTLDSRLTAAAAGHAQDMAANDYFSHASKDGRTFVDRITAQGYPAPRSENIAAGQPTVAAVMGAWMASSGHRANILDCSATQMGAASAKGGSFGIYWVQDFGRRLSATGRAPRRARTPEAQPAVVSSPRVAASSLAVSRKWRSATTLPSGPNDHRCSCSSR